MSGRGNDNHMGTNHPREPFPLQITLTLRSPPNPIDVFPTSAAKITLRTVFAANREKKNCQSTHSMPTNIQTWPREGHFLVICTAKHVNPRRHRGEVDATPSGFPRITRERIGRSSRNLVYLSIELFYIFSENFKTVTTMTFDLWPDLQGHVKRNLRSVLFQRLKLANFGIFAGDMDRDRCCEVTPMGYTDIVTIPRSTEVIRGQWPLMTS